MITITTTSQKIYAANALATGTITITPAAPYEYDEGGVRRMVLPKSIVVTITSGVISAVDGAAGTSFTLPPTTGTAANVDVANMYHQAVYDFDGVATFAQRWVLDSATSTSEILDVVLSSSASLPALTISGAAGADGATGATGQGVNHTSRTSGDGSAGTTDTYTLWGDAGETISLSTFSVYNGADGGGSSAGIKQIVGGSIATQSLVTYAPQADTQVGTGTDFQVIITPQSTNSKFIIDVRWFGECVNNLDTIFNIHKNGARLNNAGAVNTGLAMPCKTFGVTNDDSSPEYCQLRTVDFGGSDPIGTPITYTFQVYNTGASNNMFATNRTIGTGSTQDYEFGISEMTVTEVAA